ncbi:SDR family oxidoreductase [Aspergillus clavatus NRRL 1]|uniref:Short chain oxidoreductase (CsgA), putative n=1 Tax=Aspergillus clavatus (strain ATCC 1007 / CBS 513.65 / DSM 816 / NCTC 3887 / NRRL 1 / QM 1276 / 107) TaxID=344612 RepID=A1CLT9_ASPCL|nr:short chain oxidoreductase (CsgA), putative [Aspergillus clavatus NRRL 1]EAW09068.1 short chain oxidoreductase (CsgA), putative [Aspergillus clavatus NRRL 1]
MSTYLITGTSRGLGLAMVRHLASLPPSTVGTIFATSRAPSLDLQETIPHQHADRIEWVRCDTTDPQSVQDAAAQVQRRLQGRGLDVLVNNAGVMPHTRGGVGNMEELTETFHTNVTGAHLVTSAFLPLLREGRRKVVVNISTTLGSCTLSPTFQGMPTPAYKITKAALNMLTLQYAQDYAREGFTFFAVSPGWLQTDMGGARADLAPETGAKAVLDIVQDATPALNGRFLNIRVSGWEENEGLNQYDGREVPW